MSRRIKTNYASQNNIIIFRAFSKNLYFLEIQELMFHYLYLKFKQIYLLNIKILSYLDN